MAKKTIKAWAVIIDGKYTDQITVSMSPALRKFYNRCKNCCVVKATISYSLPNKTKVSDPMTIPEQLKQKWLENPLSRGVDTIRKNETADWFLSQFSEVLSEIEGKIETITYTPSPQGTLIFKDDVLAIIKSFKNEERE